MSSPRFNAPNGGHSCQLCGHLGKSTNFRKESADVTAWMRKDLCCKHCAVTKPCGDGCIAMDKTCSFGSVNADGKAGGEAGGRRPLPAMRCLCSAFAAFRVRARAWARARARLGLGFGLGFGLGARG